MKKQYHKPALLMESFRLTEHISAGCGGVDKNSNFKVTWHNASSCSLSVPTDDGMFAMFADVSNNCEEPILDEAYEHSPIEDCYNHMGDGYNYFAS